MRFLKYLWRLMGEFGGFAWHNKSWWIVPMVLVLLLIGFVAVASSGLLPFLYTIS